MSGFIKYKWKYTLTNLLYIFYGNTKAPDEVLFMTHERTKDWILGAKARRLSRNFMKDSRVFYSSNFKKIPDAKGYFFLHYKYFSKAIRYNPGIRKRKSVVMFTHPEWNKFYTKKHVAYILNMAANTICLNSAIKEGLISNGVKKEKLNLFHMASNPEFFKPKQRKGNGSVGFSMAYYERENPDIYSKMDVLVSPSHIEGGPVPLLEAMLCNVVPVATRTGFGPDLIKHGENGFLFDSTAPVDEVIPLIKKAYKLKANVREAAEQHSWKNYGEKIGKLFQVDK